jgi:DNA-binding transcriptional LysR family regulator
MDSNDLKIFRAVAAEENITKAAQALGYVQSNVTTRIQHLETELGVPLFYRQRGMVLTAEGEKLLPYAEQILHLFEEAAKVMNKSSEPSGRLAIGSTHLTYSINIPEIFSEYHKKYPKVNLSLITAKTEELITKVLNFQLDGAFVKASVLEEKNFVSELVYKEKLVLIASSETKSLQDVYKLPFLLNSVGCVNREMLMRYFNYQGIRDLTYIEFNSLDASINGVISGLGAAFVPEASISRYEKVGLLRSFSVPDEYSLVYTYFIRNKNSVVTSAFSEFIRMIKETNDIGFAINNKI